MKRQMLTLTGSALLVFALVIVGVGCSDSSIIAPSTTSDELNTPNLTGEPSIGDTQEFPITFTGHIEKIAKEELIIGLREKGMLVKVSEDTKAIVHPDRGEVRFSFRFVSVGMKITVYGSAMRDNVLEAGLIEIWDEDVSETTQSSF
jgi:hypothetical protein